MKSARNPVPGDTVGTTWVYLSPHLDDVAFSCGGLIRSQVLDGDRVEIWTLFSASPPSTLSPLARQFHREWKIEGDPMAHRKIEDRKSGRVLGAFCRHLDYQDVVYRRDGPAGDWLYPTHQAVTSFLRGEDAALKDRIAARLSRELPAAAALVVPLGLGNHVDHQVTRIAAESLGRPLRYYAEFPYALSNGEKFAAYDAAGWGSCAVALTDRAVTSWQEAAAAHRSQLDSFWGSVPEMEEAVLSYARSGGGSRLWQMPEPLEISEVGAKRVREGGLSFCIISNGERPEKLNRLLAGIRSQGIPSCETIVAGRARVNGSCRYLPDEQAAAEGKISSLRNRAAAAARFDHLVFCDDDIVLGKNWYRGIAPDLGKADLLTTRIINPDGTRFWDWTSFAGPRGQHLLEYDETSPCLYLTGGMLIVKADTWRRTLWNEHLGYREAEDVDFSYRAVNGGGRPYLCRDACVIHNDWKYTQVGRQVFMRSEEALERRRDGKLETLPAHVLAFIGELKGRREERADEADCLRACVRIEPDAERTKRLGSLMKAHGGNIEGNDNWRVDGSTMAEEAP